MEILVWLVIGALVVGGGLLWFYNRDTGADVDQDGDVDLQDAKLAVRKTLKEVNEDINAAVIETKAVVKETKRRAKRVKEEAADVVAAAKGKSRTGRKPADKKKK